MPLSPTTGHAVYSAQTVDVPMRAGEQPAQVQIMHDWLQATEPPPSSVEALTQRAEDLRVTAETIAGEKYDRGDFKLDNGVVIVRIRSGD